MYFCIMYQSGDGVEVEVNLENAVEELQTLTNCSVAVLEKYNI